MADIQLMFSACALDELQTIKFATIATHCGSKLGVMSEKKKIICPQMKWEESLLIHAGRE